MLSSALDALANNIDSKFLTAYWLPAFVAVLGGLGLLAASVGAEQMDAWIYGLDSVEQSLAVLLFLLVITMLAFVLRALTRPMSQFFAGEILPRIVADWSTRGQLKIKHVAEQMLEGTPHNPVSRALAGQTAGTLYRLFPGDDAATKPTLFGNVLAAAADHPWLAFSMNGTLWWPRLIPLLPAEFQRILGGSLAPMVALLNLSVVFAILAVGGIVVLGVVGAQWDLAVAFLGAGFLLAWLCYRAAVSQATELGSVLRVAFDLYRHEILRQWNLDVPGDITVERALWLRLTNELLGLPTKTGATTTPP